MTGIIERAGIWVVTRHSSATAGQRVQRRSAERVRPDFCVWCRSESACIKTSNQVHSSSGLTVELLEIGAGAMLTDATARLQGLTSQNAAIRRTMDRMGRVSPRDLRCQVEAAMNLAKEIAQSLKDATGTMGSADVTERARFQKLKRTLEKEIKKTQGLAERIADHERRALFEAKRQSPSSTLPRDDFATQSREPLLSQEQEQIQIDMAADQARQIQETEAEIQQIERDVVELNDMFKDMSLLVEAQQESITTIADNITSTADYTRSGYQEVQRAQHYQRNARSRMCKLLFIFVVVAAIALFILFNR